MMCVYPVVNSVELGSHKKQGNYKSVRITIICNSREDNKHLKNAHIIKLVTTIIYYFSAYCNDKISLV